MAQAKGPIVDCVVFSYVDFPSLHKHRGASLSVVVTTISHRSRNLPLREVIIDKHKGTVHSHHGDHFTIGFVGVLSTIGSWYEWLHDYECL